MKRYVLIGLLLFCGFAIAFAPAALLEGVVERNSRAQLLDTRGTIWRGQALVLIEQASIGSLAWDFQWLSLLRATPTYDWSLQQARGQLHGAAGIGFNDLQVELDGALQAGLANDWLRAYDIHLSGDLQFNGIALTANPENRAVSDLQGEITWSGGLVRYVLSGVLRETVLPPMHARLGLADDGNARAVVYSADSDTPLLIAAQAEGGFVKVGITKLFTKLLDNPWPGSDPDHEIVLEVEEHVF